MSAHKASAPVRFARLAAAGVLAVLAGAVVLHLAGRRGGGERAAAVKPPPEGRIVDLKEQVRHKEYRDGRLRADIRGDSFFLGPDGRNHLKGSVEITNFNTAGAVVSGISADEVIYDTNSLHFVISGRVRIEAGGVVLEGGSFDYDKDSGRFRTADGGAFSSDRMSGTAAEILYSESADEVLLSGGFRIEIAAAGRAAEKAALTGGSLLYQKRERRGRAEGRPAFKGGGCRGSAESLEFEVAAGESFFASVAFDGEAEVVLAGSASGPSDGSKTIVRASEALLGLLPDGGIRQWSAAGGFRLETGGGSGGVLLLEGDSIVFDASTRVLRASGKPERPAAADTPQARIEAGSITVGPAAGDLEASGGVRCYLKPGGESRSPGFFSPERPVFVSCLRLVFRDEKKSSFFSGQVRAWQDTEFLLAEELDFLEATKEMRGRGGVAAGLARASAAGVPERRVEIGGEDMSYSAADRTLSFRKKSYIQLSGARLGAEMIAAVLAPEGRGIESLTARTGVVISRGRYEGRGDAASYRAEADRVVLTGRPVLVDKEGGSSRGDKLTFDLGDDKILVENEGQGRSTTVVKS